MSDKRNTYRKKLIEVALPLDAINEASAREKSIRHGHPSTLHLWWARRPLATARAVIFAQMVDDPSEYVDVLRSDSKKLRKAEAVIKARKKLWVEAKELSEKAAQAGVSAPVPGPEPLLDDILAELERQRLFGIIEELVQWESTTNETVLQQAREEIWQSWRRECAVNAGHPKASELFNRKILPAFHDPFAGGGALPLEAQRLGLEAYASDLNPVAVLINKAMIEIPPKFINLPPVNQEARKEKTLFNRAWEGAQGLAEDVQYYGKWMREEAEKRIGHFYPKIEITKEMARERQDLKGYIGKKLTVIAWIWARTVKSPNPAFHNVDVPLASSFVLATKTGKEAFIDPIIKDGGYYFVVRHGKPKNADITKKGTSAGKWSAFRCLMSNVPISYDYIRSEGTAGRLGNRLMAVVLEGVRERVYISPTPDVEKIANLAQPWWRPELEINYHPRDIKTQIYGLTKYGDLFTSRQLVALTTFSDLVNEARELVRQSSIAVGMQDDGKPLAEGGTGASAYADAVCVYLSFAVDRMAMTGNSLVRWNSVGEKAQHCFGRQALPMLWDFAEPNFLATATGSIDAAVFYSCDPLNWMNPHATGTSKQEDAATQKSSRTKIVSTDPPYYDNIGYADLSDFFYVWLRRSLKPIFPSLFSTLAVPKAEELVATPYRHGNKEKAEAFFLKGMTQAMHCLANQAHPAFPVTIYYAFKQAETENTEGTSSTGWETFLDAVINAGFAITGTWPMRTEMKTRQSAMGMNALASSIVLVCRPRLRDAPTSTRREFITSLKATLPQALTHLQRGNIAPVDLAQAAIGPGMSVYTSYSKVLDAEGNPLSVRDALTLINQTLDEVLAEQDSDFDADTRWALAWFDQLGFSEGEYGVAETLSKAKNTSVSGMVEAGILASKAGKVRLLKPGELYDEWDPVVDNRLTIWEIVHHLIRVLEAGGEGAAAELVAQLGTKAEVARELAYRLYTLCERKKRATEALSYNGLVQSWPEIIRLARESSKPGLAQAELFGESED